MKKINTPIKAEEIEELKAGDEVLLSGIIYTARDAAHQRMLAAIHQHRQLPLDLQGQVIYYCGPTPAPKGKVIGACGPTTAQRMDKFTPLLLEQGLKAMIGKGTRSQEVVQAIKKNKAVYFLAIGGAGALLSKYVKESYVYAYFDLGPEAIYQLKVEDFPLIVGIDPKGENIYGQRK